MNFGSRYTDLDGFISEFLHFSEVSVETCVYSQDMFPAIVSVCSDIGTRDTEIAGAVGQTPTLTI
jgi:hypothetical protein